MGYPVTGTRELALCHPDDEARETEAMRLIGMVLLDQTSDWEAQRGYMSAESMKQIELRT